MKREELIEMIIDHSAGATNDVADGVWYKTLADSILKRISLPPTEGAEDDGMMFTISEDGINPLDDQPTAEGAETKLAKEQFEAIVKSTCEDVWYGRRSLNPVKEQTDLIVERLYPLFENATLHAQKIADKMVSERLREE